MRGSRRRDPGEVMAIDEDEVGRVHVEGSRRQGDDLGRVGGTAGQGGVLRGQGVDRGG